MSLYDDINNILCIPDKSGNHILRDGEEYLYPCLRYISYSREPLRDIFKILAEEKNIPVENVCVSDLKNAAFRHNDESYISTINSAQSLANFVVSLMFLLRKEFGEPGYKPILLKILTKFSKDNEDIFSCYAVKDSDALDLTKMGEYANLLFKKYHFKKCNCCHDLYSMYSFSDDNGCCKMCSRASAGEFPQTNSNESSEETILMALYSSKESFDFLKDYIFTHKEHIFKCVVDLNIGVTPLKKLVPAILPIYREFFIATYDFDKLWSWDESTDGKTLSSEITSRILSNCSAVHAKENKNIKYTLVSVIDTILNVVLNNTFDVEDVELAEALSLCMGEMFNSSEFESLFEKEYSDESAGFSEESVPEEFAEPDSDPEPDFLNGTLSEEPEPFETATDDTITDGTGKAAAPESSSYDSAGMCGNESEKRISKDDSAPSDEPKESSVIDTTCKEVPLLSDAKPAQFGPIVEPLSSDPSSLDFIIKNVLEGVSKYSVSLSERGVLNVFENTVLCDRFLAVEALTDEKKRDYLLFWGRGRKAFFHVYMDETEIIEVIKPYLTRNSYTKICYQPYHLYAFGRKYGIEIKRIFSIQSCYSFLHKTDTKLLNYEDTVNSFCNKKIGDNIVDGYPMLLAGMRMYPYICSQCDKLLKNSHDLQAMDDFINFDEALGRSYYIDSLYADTGGIPMFRLVGPNTFSFPSIDRGETLIAGRYFHFRIGEGYSYDEGCAVIYGVIVELSDKGRFRKHNIFICHLEDMAVSFFIPEYYVKYYETAFSSIFTNISRKNCSGKKLHLSLKEEIATVKDGPKDPSVDDFFADSLGTAKTE